MCKVCQHLNNTSFWSSSIFYLIFIIIFLRIFWTSISATFLNEFDHITQWKDLFIALSRGEENRDSYGSV